MVSELPAITEAVNPARLSLPTRENRSVRTEFEALPDIGLTIRKGRISEGILRISVIGDKIRERSSPAPDEVNIEAAVHIRTRLGRRFTAVLMPDSAPDIKFSNKLFLENKKRIEQKQIIHGIIRSVNFIRQSLSFFHS